MKYLKMLGLAAMAAMALMAFLGAGSASATVLCTATETPCSAANNDVKEIVATLESGTTATLRNTENSIHDTCTSSTSSGPVTNAGGAAATVVGSVTNLSFGGCTNTTTVNNAAACELELHSITGSDNGTVTARGCTVSIVEFGVTCKYGAGNGIHLGTFTGGAMGTMDVNAVVNSIDNSSFLCPTTSVWEAKYTVTTPAGAVFVEPS